MRNSDCSNYTGVLKSRWHNMEKYRRSITIERVPIIIITSKKISKKNLIE